MKNFSLAALVVMASLGCAHPHPALRGASPVLARRSGTRAYVFTSSQTTPAGSHRTRLELTLTTLPDGDETAAITGYEHADGDAPFAAAHLDAACAQAMHTPAGTIASLRITPPPRDLGQLVPTCVPEDFWGAASDILPLLMIQMQPRFRARELRSAGDRLRFDGYDARWTLPPNVLDARVRADSGVIGLDSSGSAGAVIGWDTSPMTVDIVRRLPNGQSALLHGHEWFVAALHVDPRTGELLDARTRADSLVLHLTLGYSSSSVPDVVSDTSGPPVRIVRQLELRRTAR